MVDAADPFVADVGGDRHGVVPQEGDEHPADENDGAECEQPGPQAMSLARHLRDDGAGCGAPGLRNREPTRSVADVPPGRTAEHGVRKRSDGRAAVRCRTSMDQSTLPT
jgi:hypothetical protein